MRIALAQFDPRFGEVAANLDAAAALVADAAGQGARLVLLPELFSTGYLFLERSELEELAEGPDGPTRRALVEWAVQQGCWVAGGYAERDGDQFYNSAVLVDPQGNVASHYRKIHLFNTEKQVFAPGDRPFEVVEVEGARCGLMICYDWRYPEAARSLALLGADVILHPSNLVLPWCPDAMLTRALENKVYVATCDRSGDEHRGGRELHFIGQSQVVGPDGHRAFRLGEDETGVGVADIDVAKCRDKSVLEFNHLWGDLRSGMYLREPASDG